MERELNDRISFRNFLHYPETLPDSRTIWLFRERLSSTGTDRKIWKHIWKQLEDQGIVIKKGIIQDATFIESDPGKHGKKKPPVGPELPDTVGISELPDFHTLSYRAMKLDRHEINACITDIIETDMDNAAINSFILRTCNLNSELFPKRVPS